MIAMNLEKSQVLVPSFSFIATANWPLMVGAHPKFVDIEEETLTDTFKNFPKDDT